MSFFSLKQTIVQQMNKTWRFHNYELMPSKRSCTVPIESHFPFETIEREKGKQKGENFSSAIGKKRPTQKTLFEKRQWGKKGRGAPPSETQGRAKRDEKARFRAFVLAREVYI
ncbi:hypothetical protein CEXT_677711 [Caerostris extrusa]|uniref:Uncharacterized protein n=1 Tax=Caerostris extrusa TaxID=172846 RepID=A0AAV4N1I6_CAEEX|nr:hypothetical protein CEXT_677711 [Caerostris extrusa]